MTNIDQSELKKFNQLAHTWWDKQGEFKPLHELNPLRLKFIEDQVDIKDKNIADIGCGGGILSESLTLHGAKVTGIDMAEDVLNVANLHALESHVDIDYQLTSAEALAERMPGQFDVVTCMELLEHVPDPQSVVTACAKLVKPGGIVFFSTINRTPKAYLLAILAAEYILKMLAKGTHDYEKFIRPSELEACLRQADLQLKTQQGVTYKPLSKQFVLSENCSVNYMIASLKSSH